jgi:hypothetical protein
MIQVQVHKLEIEDNHSVALVQRLAEKAVKEEFFGKIILTFEKGFLRNTKVEQSFTVQELVNTFIR